jgi:hypothetical protein
MKGEFENSLIERESTHDESLEGLSIVISLVRVILDVQLP